MLLILGAPAGTASLAAQDPASTEGRLKASFRQFDGNESGWLSGRELDACACRRFDADQNGEVTWDEFRTGSARAGGPPAPPPPPRQAVQSPARPATRTQGYNIPDRVEVNYGGTWYKGTIYGARNGTYKVMRDDYTSDDRWVTPADLRPLVEARHEDPPVANLPRVIPNGHYTCNTIVSGFGASSSMSSSIGTLRVLGPGTYTSLTKEGTGTRAGFSYDPASGRISWDGGKLQGFFGMVQSSKVFVTQRGIPGIGVIYRVREGGNLFNLDCERDGA